jgi:hypothetical protein
MKPPNKRKVSEAEIQAAIAKEVEEMFGNVEEGVEEIIANEDPN